MTLYFYLKWLSFLAGKRNILLPQLPADEATMYIVPRISSEVGCQDSLVGRHIEEPAVFVSVVVHITRI